jgi:hypothetical protein
MELMILQIQHPEYEIIGGAYPRKALGAGMCVNWDGEIDVKSTEPIEVTGIGTGFMMLTRGVFQKMDVMYPEFKYITDDPNPPYSGREIMQYFQAEIDPVSRRYLSEDYWFSKKCRHLGIKTWLCPWMKLRHVGTHIYE